jgi:exopolyphosphatase/guanosine-5'-triphosphate,3'-diphosphate pyrophosphatase
MNDAAAVVPDGPLAAVDLGSNSFHLVMARSEGGTLRIVDRLKERVALAEGLDERRMLDDASQERGLACLRRFGERLAGTPAERVRAAGTNTLRAARNADRFLAKARKALGYEIEVISGTEEARLVYQGVARTEQPGEGRRLVVDIGGGSTECVVGEGFQVVRADSLRMGCVTFTKGFFPGGGIDADRLGAARFAASVELEPLLGPIAELGYREAMGSSGTNKEIAGILEAMGVGHGTITRKGLDALADACIDAKEIDDLDLPGLSSSRRPVLIGGLAILMAVFEAFRIDEMRPSEGALREGLLFDLLGRAQGEDLREQSVDALARRYGVDETQAARVRETTLAFLEQVADAWEIGDRRVRQALGWAARLHEVGLAFRHSGYHKHGAYVVEASDLPGFTREEQTLLAGLVRAHRRKFRHEPLEELGGALGEQAVRAATLLRLAVRVHRSRGARDLPRPTLEVRPPEGKKAKKELPRGTLVVRFPPGTLDEHPLLRTDLGAERERLERGGVALEVA